MLWGWNCWAMAGAMKVSHLYLLRYHGSIRKYLCSPCRYSASGGHTGETAHHWSLTALIGRAGEGVSSDQSWCGLALHALGTEQAIDTLLFGFWKPPFRDSNPMPPCGGSGQAHTWPAAKCRNTGPAAVQLRGSAFESLGLWC